MNENKITDGSVFLKKRQISNRLRPGTKNYNRTQKVFSNDDVNLNAKQAKEFIKNYTDPDILELQQTKNWNYCSNLRKTNDSEKKDLDRILFDVKFGLTDVNSIKLNEKKIFDGVEVKYINDYLRWNVSTTLDNKEKFKLHTIVNKSAKENSENFQKNHIESNGNKLKFNNIIYRTPIERTSSITNNFREVKSETCKLRESIKKE